MGWTGWFFSHLTKIFAKGYHAFMFTYTWGIGKESELFYEK